jgi:hypothetical protein
MRAGEPLKPPASDIRADGPFRDPTPTREESHSAVFTIAERASQIQQVVSVPVLAP